MPPATAGCLTVAVKAAMTCSMSIEERNGRITSVCQALLFIRMWETGEEEEGGGEGRNIAE